MLEAKRGVAPPDWQGLPCLSAGRLGVFRRKYTLSPRWEGPSEVLLNIYTAIKMKEKASQIHVSHVKIDPEHHSQDTWETVPTGDLKLRISMTNSQAPEQTALRTRQPFQRSQVKKPRFYLPPTPH